jgi:hypothetical protein
VDYASYAGLGFAAGERRRDVRLRTEPCLALDSRTGRESVLFARSRNSRTDSGDAAKGANRGVALLATNLLSDRQCAFDLSESSYRRLDVGCRSQSRAPGRYGSTGGRWLSATL